MSDFFLPIVLLYVRTGTEEVFDALMLSTPTLSGLREAVSDIHKHIPESPDLISLLSDNSHVALAQH